MSFNLPPIPAAKRPRTTLIKARIRKRYQNRQLSMPAILISLPTRQEQQLTCFDMLAKSTRGWGSGFVEEQSKCPGILNGTSSSAGPPELVRQCDFFFLPIAGGPFLRSTQKWGFFRILPQVKRPNRGPLQKTIGAVFKASSNNHQRADLFGLELGTAKPRGTPACVLLSAGRAQERSSPSQLSRSLFFSPSSARGGRNQRDDNRLADRRQPVPAKFMEYFSMPPTGAVDFRRRSFRRHVCRAAGKGAARAPRRAPLRHGRSAHARSRRRDCR